MVKLRLQWSGRKNCVLDGQQMRKTEEDVAASERSFADTRSGLCCSFREDIGDAVGSVENIGQGDLEGTIDALNGDGNSANSCDSGFSFADSNG